MMFNSKLKYRLFLPLFISLGVILLYFLAQNNYLLFHSIIELSTIAIAFALFLVAWNVKDRTNNYNLIYLGIAYFFVGGIDLFHTFSYKGMGIFHYNYFSSELWISARYMESISLLIFMAIAGKKKPFRFEMIFSIYLVITGLLLASIYYWDLFPVCYVPETGQTGFKIYSEYIICGILAVAFWGLYRNRMFFDKTLLKLLSWSIVLSIAAELCFSLYVNVFGFMNFTGHIFKLASFYLIYKAIIENGLRQPFNVIFRELTKNEALLNMTQEVARIGGWEYDLNTKELNWTDEVFQIHELPLDHQVDFNNALGFYQEDSIQKIKDTVKQISNTGGKEDLELEMTTSRGRKIWVRITFAARVENGQTVGLYGIIQDITEDKNIESLREDMERINRHDLKIPLNSIYIAAQLLDKKKTEDDYRKIADIIKTSTYRLMDMINLSLSIYKIEEGAYKLSASPFNLAEVLKRIIKEQLPIVEFDLKIDPGSFSEEKAFIINGEESLIYSMLCNLLKNAVDASSIDEKIKINLRNRDNVCVLEIKNRRVIPEELRDCFFSKYTTSGKKGGVGLGTYGAKLIAELHRGDISMISSDEQGTVVTVELPFDTETVINLEEML